MKRLFDYEFLALLALLAALVLALSGCGGGDEPEADERVTTQPVKCESGRCL